MVITRVGRPLSVLVNRVWMGTKKEVSRTITMNGTVKESAAGIVVVGVETHYTFWEFFQEWMYAVIFLRSNSQGTERNIDTMTRFYRWYHIRAEE